MDIDELRNLLNEFLNRWKIENVKKITLNEYVGLRNKDTFCQWVETKTRILGSIKGLPGSIKFGIYERNDKNKKPKGYDNDSSFSWLKAYNCNNRNDAFKKVKDDILKTIEYSFSGDFKSIDNLLLPDIFKWKIAFLYSNERLIPIYKRDVLFNIATNLGLEVNNNTKVSDIQYIMMQNKPPNLSVYEYMRKLYDQFGKKNSNNLKEEKLSGRGSKKRKAATNKNINPQLRTIIRSYISEQKHNKLQEALKDKLIEEYGAENVKLEENYVDVKVIQPDYINFYEVKSDSYASECVIKALGQILYYCFSDGDGRNKKLIVAGQFPPNNLEKNFIEYLKVKLNIDFDYLEIKLSNGS